MRDQFAELLANRQRASGISVKDLAVMCQLTPSTVRRVLVGYSAAVDTVDKVARALGIRIRVTAHLIEPHP